VKGVNFVDLRDAGDAVELASRYAHEGIDELVFLDITDSSEIRKTTADFAAQVAKAINIPFIIGGGIASVQDAARLLEAGADKISVNSAALGRPALLNELVAEFGQQFVTVAVDAKRHENHWQVYSHAGRVPTAYELLTWSREVEARGVGELLLTSMGADGTKKGFDLAMTKALAETVKILIIASGGAGSAQDFVEVFQLAGADAALAASLFHFREIAVPELKNYLNKCKIPARI
jgi:cyclase